jgi:dipeptidyl aminopeptidase/acylaminoacyl peptidase
VRAEDGTAVDAWLTAAPGPAPRPLLVNVHGGPHGAVGWRFTAETQRMAARGYAVLTLNPRGSQGYGEDFARAIRDDWGGVDWSDVLAAADTASRLRTVDGSRAAIWGVSYGGFMAMWAVTRTGRFAAAVSENGRSDLVGAWDRVTTPLMLIHAQDDQVCPVAQSERARAALRALGREVELVRIPGEGHLMNLVGRPSSRQRRADAIDRFLAAALRPDAAPSG